jgi:hypothetical protein
LLPSSSKGHPSWEIVVTPNMPHEGKSRESTPQLDSRKIRGNKCDSLKRKLPKEDESDDLDNPRKTREKQIDYQHLNDPFSEEEGESDEDNIVIQLSVTAANAEALSERDEPKSLREAQRSSEWPEWEQAIKEELDQLYKKRTWILLSKPASAILIKNKWVFTKKFIKDSDLIRYKGWLIVRDCLQRPGQD